MMSEKEGHARMSRKKVTWNVVDLCNMNLILELAGFIVGWWVWSSSPPTPWFSLSQGNMTVRICIKLVIYFVFGLWFMDPYFLITMICAPLVYGHTTSNYDINCTKPSTQLSHFESLKQNKFESQDWINLWRDRELTLNDARIWDSVIYPDFVTPAELRPLNDHNCYIKLINLLT